MILLRPRAPFLEQTLCYQAIQTSLIIISMLTLTKGLNSYNSVLIYYRSITSNDSSATNFVPFTEVWMDLVDRPFVVVTIEDSCLCNCKTQGT